MQLLPDRIAFVELGAAAARGTGLDKGSSVCKNKYTYLHRFEPGVAGTKSTLSRC